MPALLNNGGGGGGEEEAEQQLELTQKIARVLDEVRSSHATHLRKLKELSALRSRSSVSSEKFFAAFCTALTPLFDFQRRTSSAERIIRFVAIFAGERDSKNASHSDAFLEQFLRFLLVAAVAANKTARIRACQIISEVIWENGTKIVWDIMKIYNYFMQFYECDHLFEMYFVFFFRSELDKTITRVPGFE